MDIKSVASEYAEYVIELRRHFHRYPELSGREKQTAEKIREELDYSDIEWRKCGTEGYGTLATIRGSRPGRTVLLRADMDALPVNEETGVSYASENTGVMHACGHDCHMAMLLTAARILSDMSDDLTGEIRLAFQPAEETAEGAKWMIADDVLDGVDVCFAIHVWSGFPAGTFCCKSGPVMAAARYFEIDINGRGGHGAMPHESRDAIVAGSAIVGNMQTLVSRHYSPMEPVVVTVGSFEAPGEWNVISGHAKMIGTTRCYNIDIHDEIMDEVKRIAEATGNAYDVDVKVTDRNIAPPTINDDEVAEVARGAAYKVMGHDAEYDMPTLTSSEDYAYYLQKVPGAMMFLGIENEACASIYGNHNPKFNVDEDILLNGAMIYSQVAIELGSNYGSEVL